MSDTKDNKTNKSDGPVMEVGRRKADALLILFRVQQYNEKTDKVPSREHSRSGN